MEPTGEKYTVRMAIICLTFKQEWPGSQYKLHEDVPLYEQSILSLGMVEKWLS